MALLKKCAECKRVNGYAATKKDKVCARCKGQKVKKDK